MKKLAALIEAHDKLTYAIYYNADHLPRKVVRRYKKLKQSLERRILTSNMQVLCGMTWYMDGSSTMHFAIPTTPYPNVLPIFYKKTDDTKDKS